MPVWRSEIVRAALAALLLAAPGAAQSHPPGPRVLTFYSAIDDSDQPYAVYVPKGYDASRRYPLVVSLHGAWSNHRLNLRRVFGKGNVPGETDTEASRHFPSLPDVPFLVASPLARGTMGYQAIAERDVMDMLDDVRRRFAVDDDRVYLTGLSMGGGGTLWIGLTRPHLWAALAPVCPAPPKEAAALAGNAPGLPVHLFHGALDPVVSVEVSRRGHKMLLEAGSPAEYVEYPAVRHNAWDHAYKDAAIFEWFAKHKRNRYPDRVHYTALAYKHDTAYWVRLDRLTPGEPAAIDARFTANNRVRVETIGLDAFTLTLAGHPRFSPGQPLIVELDGATLRVKPAGEASFRKTGGEWESKPYTPPPGVKRKGAEGPIVEAWTDRHLYVYGTVGAEEWEVERRRREAEQAANWATPRHRPALTPRILADKNVGEADARGANLILWGTRETNSWLERLAPALPLHLNPSAAGYGLLYIYPVEGRYVVVHSGLPFTTGLEQARRSDFPFLPPIYGALLSFGDFILFKGSLENVVAEGRFDPDWKLPAGAAARMKATGAVTAPGW